MISNGYRANTNPSAGKPRYSSKRPPGTARFRDVVISGLCQCGPHCRGIGRDVGYPDETIIANVIMRPKIELICRTSGYEPPVICTPPELVEE
jgi:hypothetical protein